MCQTCKFDFLLQIIQNNLKGYPHFSYARFVPLSEIESVKLRSEMNEYTKENA